MDDLPRGAGYVYAAYLIAFAVYTLYLARLR